MEGLGDRQMLGEGVRESSVSSLLMFLLITVSESLFMYLVVLLISDRPCVY